MTPHSRPPATFESFSDRIASLRRRIAAIEGGTESAPERLSNFVVACVARDDGARHASLKARGPAPPLDREPSGSRLESALERLLQNLAGDGFAEIVPSRARDGAGAAGFAFALALRAVAARPAGRLVWISEDMAAREIGLPYGKGLEAAGLDPRRIILARTRNGAETLWATEEALRSPAAVVVAETWTTPHAYGLAVSRRLLLAQRRGGGLGLLLLLRAAGATGRLASAAPLRFEVRSAPPERAAPENIPPSTPGALAWRLRLAKARSGLAGRFLGEIDPQLWRDVAFALPPTSS